MTLPLPTTTPRLLRPADEASPSRRVLDSIRSVLLLAGAVGQCPWQRRLGRLTLDLPITAERSIAALWRQEGLLLNAHLGRPVPWRVLADWESVKASDRRGGRELPIEPDPYEFRGTGGLLHDVAADFHDDDFLLVMSAGMVLLQPLWRLVDELSAKPADVAILCHDDYEPADVMLLRCAALRQIKALGFVDFKEQALPAIAAQHSTRVVRWPQCVTGSARNRELYLQTLRQYYLSRTPPTLARELSLEPWRSAFSVVEPLAQVDPEAIIHDSVVLAGARVEARAMVVRSVIGPTVRIHKHQQVVDAIAARSFDED